MKIKQYIYMLFILCFVTLYGCTNLDENVYSTLTEDSYTYSEKDFLPVIGSIYPPLRGLLDREGFYAAQEITADAIVMPPNASGWDDGGLFRRMHYQTWNSEQRHVSKMWDLFYKGALLCNAALDKIEKGIVPAPSPEEKARAIAEIKAMRAFYYWLICDNYGDAPLSLDTSTDLLGKSPRKAIYDQIVKDLTESFEHLKKEANAQTYGTMHYWAAKALLANVYLNAEVYTGEPKWAECLLVCNEIITKGGFELEDKFKDAFKADNRTSKEILLIVQYDEKYGTGNAIHMFSWHSSLSKKFNLKSTPWGAGSAQGVTQFIDTYHPNDTRLQDTWLLGAQYAADGVTRLLGAYDSPGKPLEFRKDLPDGNYTSEMEGYRMNKLEVLPGTQSNSNTDFPLFRYAQILLMKAECLLRQGNAGDAAIIVTDVRKRAFKANPSDATVTGAQLAGNSVYKYGYVENYQIVDKGNTDAILYGAMLDELGWEFAWETFRRRDLIRFGVFTKKSWLSHKPQGDHRVLFPIPEAILTSNRLLEQNPNYISK